MNDGALDDALEPGGRLRIFVPLAHQVFEFALQVSGQAPAQLVDIDIAGPHDGCGILVVDQREQQVLERGVLVVALVSERERPMQRLFKVARESGHVGLVFAVRSLIWARRYFFSITHWRGC